MDYSIEKQKLYLSTMISIEDAYVQVSPIIKPIYFHTTLRRTVSYIYNYTNEYNTVPTVDQIETETGIKLKELEEKVVCNIGYKEWFLKEFEEFCRYKSIEQWLTNGPDLLSEGKYGDLEKGLKESLLISINKDIGTDYFENPKERLENMLKNEDQMLTGYKDLDYHLGGGYRRSELIIWAAGSGGGKSLIMQNQALKFAKDGKNIVYISLELKEDLVAKRMDSMVTGVNPYKIFKDIDHVDRFVKQTKLKGQYGNILIKKFPESGTDVNTLKAYLKELQIKKNIIPDVIFVDYLDLMYPTIKGINMSDTSIKDKIVSEELRSLAGTLNCVVVSASQLNRSAVGEQELDHSHIAGGLTKIQTCDSAMALFKYPSRADQYVVQFLKTRSSSGLGKKIKLTFDEDTLIITDGPEEENGFKRGIPKSSHIPEPEDTQTNSLEDRTQSIMRQIGL